MFHFQRERYFIDQMKASNVELESDKRNLPIAIIDDNDVPYIETLRNNGFNVTHHHDLDSFSMAKTYPIIICDIKGVGKKFGSLNEGAHIIQELRRLYPDKYLIAMSSAVYNIKWVKLLDDADDKIIRDAEIDQVMDALNTAINVMRCNKERWIRVRKNLLNVHHMDLFDVWKIEQSLIKSAVKKNKEIFNNSTAVKHSEDIVKGLLVNFISGLIF